MIPATIKKTATFWKILQRDALVAEVAYPYPVAGSYYSGHNEVVSTDEAEAWTYIDRYRKGDSVCVYYDPQKPEHSAIESGNVRTGKYLAPGLGLLLLGVLVLLEQVEGHRTSDISTTASSSQRERLLKHPVHAH